MAARSYFGDRGSLADQGHDALIKVEGRLAWLAFDVCISPPKAIA
jgi:hypothetical protein